ncbi:hypothetical protein LCGC14_0698750 [marine sediment metagenome]|uniref:Uncharacterized protein n=1 Tax=marine sediment metagenome TaxID=412755 RepID=A0A0F9T4C0_9ZZZZ
MNKKKEKAKAKLTLRLRRLVARLTLLNSQIPEPGSSEHRRKTWADERAQIIRQLRRHGVGMEQ